MYTKNLFVNLTDPLIFQSFGGEKYWEVVNVPVGTVVLKEGEVSSDFYYVFAGALSVGKSVKDEVGTQKILAHLASGDFFGEGALLSDNQRAATVMATEDCKLLKLSQRKFEELVQADPQAAVALILGILKVLNVRFQDTNERLTALYKVVSLMSSYSGDLPNMLKNIFSELKAVSHHGNFALFGMDGLVQYKCETMKDSLLEVFSREIPDFANKLKVNKDQCLLKNEERMYCSVHNSFGELVAILATEVCPECENEDIRLVGMVAEHMGQFFR